MTTRKKIVFAALAWALLLAVLEAGARVWAAFGPAPTAAKPARFQANAAILVPDPFRAFRLNPAHPDHTRQGFRGRVDYEPHHRGLRIVCMGESSTYGSQVDEPECFPRQLELALAGDTDPAIEVINAGVPAYSTPQVIAHLALCVVDLAPDLVVFYLGFNDTSNRLEFPGFRSDYTHAVRAWTDDTGKPWWRSSVFLDRFATLVGAPWTPAHIHAICFQPTRGAAPENWQAGDSAIFARNLTSLVALCRAHRIRPVFCTQPANPGKPRAGSQELWRPALDETDATLRATMQQLGVDLIDVRPLLHERSEYFADVIHLNAAGNRECARIIADGLRRLEVLRETPRLR